MAANFIVALLALAILAITVSTASAQSDLSSQGGLLAGGGATGAAVPGAIGNATGAGGLAAAIQQLGITPEEAAELQSQLAAGPLGQAQIDELCARFASSNLTQADVDSIADAMGLDARLRAKLQACWQTGQMPQVRQSAGPTTPPTPTAAQGPAAAEPLSPVERDFQELDQGTAAKIPTPRNLRQFGYSLFASEVSTFAPVGNVPVGDGYIVGPGDELNVILWGRVNQTLDFEVQRDGTILVPQLGPLQVAGLTFEQARKLIEGRVGQITGVRVDVTMGRLRTIQVFVVGEVKEPGAYTVSALSHVSNALAAAGGITRVGSLRDVQLRRGGRIIRAIDLYQFLMHGQTANDVRLEPQDVIFVPVTGPVAGVVGDVKRPAIYELGRRSEDLSTVLGLAGGINAFGYADRIQVERIENHQRRIVLDLDFEALSSRRFRVEDGDLIKVFPVLPQRQNAVTLSGNVNRPGNYEWTPGMRVDDLVTKGEGIGDNTFMQYALIRRIEGPARKVHFIPVNLGQALRDGDSGADLTLRPHDELTVYNATEMHDAPVVRISGEVRRPGAYPLNEGMDVGDLIHLAGGLKADAYLEQGELVRTQVIDGAKTSRSYMDIDLRSALAGLDHQDLPLERNDELLVRSVPGWHLPWTVTVKGEVTRPGVYSVRQGERLHSLLERCGGLLPDAYPQGAVFIRQAVREVEMRQLAQSKARLEQNLAQLQLYAIQRRSETANIPPAETPGALKYLETVLDQSKNIQAQGRVVLHIGSVQALANSPDDVALENDDQLIIPRRPSSVSVLGQVYSPSALVYYPDLTVRDYLARAGGPNELGDAANIMVVRADGSIVTEKGLENTGKGYLFPLLRVVSGGLMATHLQPGDTIFVPEKLFYADKLQVTKDVATIIGQSALGLGTLALLAATL
jgi:protein involved in polysaccharide export with SLBB domain